MGRSTTVLVLGAALAVTSCAKTYHVDDASGQSLILSARDRVILTKARVSNDPTVPVVCAEPNPDVAVRRDVEVTLTGNVTPAEAAPGGSVSGNVRKTLLALTRSNAIQVLRDVGYRACEAYMNEAIGTKEYDRILGGTGTTITAVVAVEALREQLRADGKAADAIKEVVQIVNGSHINQQRP